MNLNLNVLSLNGFGQYFVQYGLYGLKNMSTYMSYLLSRYHLKTEIILISNNYFLLISSKNFWLLPNFCQLLKERERDREEERGSD